MLPDAVSLVALVERVSQKLASNAAANLGLLEKEE